HHARLVTLVGARWPPQTLTASRHRFPIFFGIDDHFLTTELAEHVRWSAHHLLIDIERASAASTFAALLFDHCLLLPPCLLTSWPEVKALLLTAIQPFRKLGVGLSCLFDQCAQLIHPLHCSACNGVVAILLGDPCSVPLIDQLVEFV